MIFCSRVDRLMGIATYLDFIESQHPCRLKTSVSIALYGGVNCCLYGDIRDAHDLHI